ncbi:hypothetical protein Dimus_032913 [Dionaea muscipula]
MPLCDGRGMASFPLDVIIDVLAKLPVKPLMRFKCVSRSWNNIISDPDFMKLHLKQSLETNSHINLIIGSPLQFLYSLDLESNQRTKLHEPFGGLKSSPSIVGSCNGLLCLRYHDSDHTLVLYNPATQYYKKLPPSCRELPNYSMVTGWGDIGFGYHSACDDFKVVRMIQFPGMEGFRYLSVVEVYSMKIDSWKRVQCPPCLVICHSVTAALVNEFLHWIGIEYPGSDSYYSIVSFSLADESFAKVPHPKLDPKHRGLNLGVLNDCLSLMVHHEEYSDVWMMKNDGVESSWIKLYRIPLARVDGPYCNAKPVAYSRSGRELFFWLRGKGLFSFDIEDKSFKQVDIHGFSTNSTKNEAILCVESLVQLKDGCNVTRKEKGKLLN